MKRIFPDQKKMEPPAGKGHQFDIVCLEPDSQPIVNFESLKKSTLKDKLPEAVQIVAGRVKHLALPVVEYVLDSQRISGHDRNKFSVETVIL
ncbi:MAG: hypothetical protein JRI76_03780 [Deltaproteobacteria bacterium]|nr:hypothetical protein [Deltaproteobacteria bacterium]MBW2041134.1 hypothetical protein [Deltaproteobacteria bacterium]MBW2131918.1 hypothetical protein [Deltaproteobacteria bacterium]